MKVKVKSRKDVQFLVAFVDVFVSCWGEGFESDHR